MNGSRNVWIGGGVLGLVVVALVALWFAGRPDPADGVDVEVDPVTGERIVRGEEGVVRGEKAGRRRGRRLRDGVRPDGPGARGEGARTSDTAPAGEEDTGVTREMLIDEMIEDVAQDTGMNEEEKERMQEALLRVRDVDPDSARE